LSLIFQAFRKTWFLTFFKWIPLLAIMTLRLTEKETFDLIESVKACELLWDPANNDHKESTKVFESWNKIGDTFSNETRTVTG